jgi:hypothetical protein
MISACCSSKVTNSKLKPDTFSYKRIAEEKFNNNYKVSFNQDSTSIIVYYYPKNVTKQLFPPLKFFVYSSRNNEIIFQDNLPNGTVKWINDHQLQVSTIPEIVKGGDKVNEENFGYVYDVFKKRKVSDQDNSK